MFKIKGKLCYSLTKEVKHGVGRVIRNEKTVFIYMKLNKNNNKSIYVPWLNQPGI